MAQADLTSLAAVYKTLYPPEAIKNLVYANHPFFALVRKDESFDGVTSTEPITIGLPQNVAATFSNANTVNSTSIAKAFLLTRVQNYSTAAISNEAMLASESDKGAFVRLAKYEMDNALRSLSNSLCTQLYRDGTGTIGQIGASATINSTTTKVVLANPEDIVNFELNMNLAFSATSGGSLRAYVSTNCFVVQIDRGAGSFLASATVGGSATALTSLITSVADSDYIYANSGNLNKTLSGLQAWLPSSVVAASDSFFGINRSVDTRLSGVYFNGAALSIEEALIEGARRVGREGGRPDHCFVSFYDYSNLVKALGSKQQYIQKTDVKSMEQGVTLGFSALVVDGPTGPINVIADKDCTAGTAYMLQLDTFTYKSLGSAARIFNGDGLTWIRDPNNDNMLIRCVSYSQLSCRAPGWNARIALPA